MPYKKRDKLLLQHIRCPECGVAMIERQSTTGTFYGCARFPICIGSRPQGEGFDSYSKLLHVAYVKATRFLSGPRFIGHKDIKAWLLTKALDREPTLDELDNNHVESMPNEYLERAIDAACEYASDATGNEVDFLLFAHEERYEALKGRLRYLTTAEQIREMPRPEIIRRYDSSDLAQFEADLAPQWKKEGCLCPRCGAWSDSKGSDDVLQVGSEALPLSELNLKPKDLVSLFESTNNVEEELTSRRKWDCGRCGIFVRIETKKGANTTLRFEYENDKKEGHVAGASFRLHDNKTKK